jgi:uncharacterized membrane protein YGL010W
MRKIDRLLTEYGESHQNVTNKTIHWVCVPLIFLSITGLIAAIPATTVRSMVGNNIFSTWATVALLLVTLYYASLSISLTVGMILFSIICLAIINLFTKIDFVPLWLVCIVIFVAAWIGQFYGHKVEGKKPSFFKDLQFLLIGPAWLMHFIYKKIGINY